MITTKATVFIVDDDEASRESQQELMESIGLETRAFSSAQEFLASYDEEWHGCLLLDVRMPGMSGLKLQDELTRRGCQLPIIFLTGHGDVPMAVETLRKGAVDFVEKPAGGQYLLDKVHEAIDKADCMQRLKARKRDISAKLARLTPREKEVLEYIKQGKRPKTIAFELGLSRKTVDWHFAVLRKKLAVDSTGELMLLLHEGDLL